MAMDRARTELRTAGADMGTAPGLPDSLTRHPVVGFAQQKDALGETDPDYFPPTTGQTLSEPEAIRWIHLART